MTVTTAARLAFCAFVLTATASAGEQMRRDEQPDQMGLTIIADAVFPIPEGAEAFPVVNGNLESSKATGWTLNNSCKFVDGAKDAVEGKAYIQGAAGPKPSAGSPPLKLIGSRAHLLSLWARTTVPLRATIMTDSPTKPMRWIYLTIPSTAGKWKRIGLYFRAPYDVTSGSLIVTPDDDTENKDGFALDDVAIRTATEEEFGAQYKIWRATRPAHDTAPRPDDGKNLALAVKKLQGGGIPGKPFLIWAIGSSYTNMLGNGQTLIQAIRERFPQSPPIVYRKHVGSAVPYEYVRGWARQFVIAEQPDVVLIYTLGEAAGLDKMLADLRKHTTADIIVPNLHLRRADKLDEASIDTAYWREIRDVCRKFDVEFVDNRREGAEFMRKHGLKIEDLTRDDVHQNDLGALIINENIGRHFNVCAQPSYDPLTREKSIPAKDAAKSGDWKDEGGMLRTAAKGATLELSFAGTRADVLGVRSANGGAAKVFIDGKPANEFPAFYTTVIDVGDKNAKPERGAAGDQSPHAVLLGAPGKLIPQSWRITMLDDQGNYELTGSVTGADGKGHIEKLFTSNSGQINIEPELWRRGKVGNDYSNKSGDVWTFDVYRATADKVSFKDAAATGKGGHFHMPLAQNLPHGAHTIKLVAEGDGEIAVEAFQVYTPPLK